MPFLHAFQLSMFAQVFVASGLLAAAEGGPAPALLTFVVGLAALIFNDREGTFGLSEWWANGFALGAFALAAVEFMGDSPEAKLLAGTHLIVYLLWIVLLWKREMRHFWWISALCLLHVALAAVLTQAGWFGMALVGYVVLMVWNLTLFSLYRAEQDVITSATVFDSTGASPAAQAQVHSRVRGNVQSDYGASYVGWRLFGGSLSTSFLALLVGATIFVLTPRIWMTPPENMAQRRSSQNSTVRSVTGFTEEVRLGDIGEILESNEPVLTMRAFDHKSDQPVDILQLASDANMSEPYLRGSVLVNYNNGTWHPSTVPETHLKVERKPGRFGRFVKQQITLEPLGTELLFAMRPFNYSREIFGGLASEEATLIAHLPSLTFSRSSGSNRVSYTIYSRYPQDVTARRPDLWPYTRIRLGAMRDELVNPPGPRLRRLEALARRVADGVGRDTAAGEDQSLAVARALESHLRDSGEYQYSLNASIQDPNVDPVEDFLFNRKVGHCEYYAAALTLMLRAVGIPSRMVNGFKGGEYNPEDMTLHVEQRHAHSWVEAAIGYDWITLDPTPAGERERIVASHKPGLWESFSRGFWRFWTENVVSVNLANQEQELFRPMLAYLSEAFSSTEGMRAAAADFWNWFIETVSTPEKWISIDGGILVFIVLLLPVLIFYAVRALWRRLMRRWRKGTQAKRDATRRVEFYERFQELARRMGYVRQPAQTQREFAAAVHQGVSTAYTPEGGEDHSDEIAESFYRVRFGEDHLSDAEEREIKQQLQTLETLSRRKPR